MPTHSIRRSIALPQRLVDEVVAVAPPELRSNWNRLVILALENFARERRKLEFEAAMATMAADLAIQQESATIQTEFSTAEADGLNGD